MTYIHHSCRPLKLCDLYDGNQANATDWGAKPAGLWFSVGDGADWRELCRKNKADEDKQWSLDCLRCQTEIVFCECAKVLSIHDAAEIDALTAEYGSDREDGRQSISWYRIAKNFDAIVIAPLCVDRCNHHPTRWYKCWEWFVWLRLAGQSNKISASAQLLKLTAAGTGNFTNRTDGAFFALLR